MLISTLKNFTNFLSRRTLLAVIIVLVVGVLINILNSTSKKTSKAVPVFLCNSIHVDSIRGINSNIVLPVVYQNVPNLKSIHYKKRMQKFTDMMLPSILLARKKMLLERQNILELSAAVQNGLATEHDSISLEKIKKQFKSRTIDEVLKRLHPHPVSIILAQAAIESGWGTSRFCKEANNIYGIWSYNSKEKRIKASESRDGNNIYLRKYDSLFDSTYDYLITIARANAYRQFREARLHSDNPYRLIWYLSNYSEKRYEYVRTLRNVIEFNDLHKYDSYKLPKIDKNDPIWKDLID